MMRVVSLQLENIDVVLADHMQRVMKPNFAASWEEIGEENQVEETFALSAVNDMNSKKPGDHVEFILSPPLPSPPFQTL